MNIFKRGLKKAKQFGRAIDPTYSKGTIGRITAPIAKPLVATAAVGLTGGTILIKRPDLLKPALKGYSAGAAIGTGIAAGGALGGVTKGASFTASQYADSVRQVNGTVGNGNVAAPTDNPVANPSSPAGMIAVGLIVGAVALAAFSKGK